MIQGKILYFLFHYIHLTAVVTNYFTNYDFKLKKYDEFVIL